MKGIHKALLLGAVFALCTALFADWSGFVGYVYEDIGDPAYPAYVKAWKTGFEKTVPTDRDGWYELSCPGGTYTMKAWDADQEVYKYNVVCNGWSTRVDFYLPQNNPDQGDE